MSTRTKLVTVHVCRTCGRDCDYCATCTGCGETFCHSCDDSSGVTYRHAVYCSGSGDVFLCLSCKNKLEAAPTALFLALLKIVDLRLEAERWRKDFDLRVDQAEAGLKNLQKGAA